MDRGRCRSTPMRDVLASRYGRMLDAGEPFDALIERCVEIETISNMMKVDDGHLA